MRNRTRLIAIGLALVTTSAFAACSNDDGNDGASNTTIQQGTETPVDEGRTVKIAFSAPVADHGWTAAVTANAHKEAERLGSKVDLILLEGTNDSAAQVSQVESLMAQKPDVLVILPHEGDALTPVALQAMAAGAGGSKQAFDLIKKGGLYRATFLYNPSMAASAIRIARLIALGQGFSELLEPEVPSYIQLPATQVTKDNVDDVYDLGF